MSLTILQVQRQFENAASEFPGLCHQLLVMPQGRRHDYAVPDACSPTPAMTAGDSGWVATVPTYGRHPSNPESFLDGQHFEHWVYLRFAELGEHDYQREHTAWMILRRLAEHAVHFIPTAKRVPVGGIDAKWLLYLQLRVQRERKLVPAEADEPLPDAWMTSIPDVFLESVDALESLMGMPAEIETALRAAGVQPKPLTLLKLLWCVPSVQQWQLAPAVWEELPKPDMIRTAVRKANDGLTKIKSDRTLATAGEIVYWSTGYESSN